LFSGTLGCSIRRKDEPADDGTYQMRLIS
jgi:hypothetical protein